MHIVASSSQGNTKLLAKSIAVDDTGPIGKDFTYSLFSFKALQVLDVTLTCHETSSHSLMPSPVWASGTWTSLLCMALTWKSRSWQMTSCNLIHSDDIQEVCILLCLPIESLSLHQTEGTAASSCLLGSNSFPSASNSFYPDTRW